MTSQTNPAPTAQPAATTVVAPTAQPAATTVVAPTAPPPVQPTPAPVQSTPLPAPETTSPDTLTQLQQRRVLTIKSSGEDVAQLQQRLRELGYFTYPTNTGYFGETTLRAIAQFQSDQGLEPTGVVDSRIVELLNGCTKDCALRNNTGESSQ
jgi:peptidoglycan hydrolase-like protein with peptidoglycan-binding domain